MIKTLTRSLIALGMLALVPATAGAQQGYYYGDGRSGVYVGGPQAVGPGHRPPPNYRPGPYRPRVQQPHRPAYYTSNGYQQQQMMQRRAAYQRSIMMRRVVTGAAIGAAGYGAGYAARPAAAPLPSPAQISASVPHQTTRQFAPCDTDAGYVQNPQTGMCSRTRWVPN